VQVSKRVVVAGAMYNSPREGREGGDAKKSCSKP